MYSALDYALGVEEQSVGQRAWRDSGRNLDKKDQHDNGHESLSVSANDACKAG